MTRNILSTRQATRRKVLKYGAAASALPWVHIRTAGAAGTVSIFFWDHWVPAGNVEIRKQVEAFSQKTKTEVKADFITSQGQQTLLTINNRLFLQTPRRNLHLLQYNSPEEVRIDGIPPGL